MKSTDAQLLAQAARAFGEVAQPAAVRGAGTTLAAAAEGWLEMLRLQGVAASSPQGTGLDTRTAPAANVGGQGEGQLLAAAHAVAAYWLTASAATLLESASEVVASGGQAVSIRVNHLTPEGGLAAVELRHPELGELAIEVSLSGRTLSVLATVESEHAATAIRESQAALAQRLSEQGITLQTLDVAVLRRKGRAPKPKSKRQES